MRVDSKQNGKRSRARKRQRGQALVETALVLLVTLSMILFIFDMGRILLTEQFISERARVAVRNAVVNSWDATAVKNYVAYGSTGHLRGDPDDDDPGILGINPSQVTFTSYPDSGIGDARYQVTVSGVPMFTFVPYLPGSFNAPSVTATAPVQSLGSTN